MGENPRILVLWLFESNSLCLRASVVNRFSVHRFPDTIVVLVESFSAISTSQLVSYRTASDRGREFPSKANGSDVPGALPGQRVRPDAADPIFHSARGSGGVWIPSIPVGLDVLPEQEEEDERAEVPVQRSAASDDPVAAVQ